jgi:hypothetical protein
LSICRGYGKSSSNFTGTEEGRRQDQGTDTKRFWLEDGNGFGFQEMMEEQNAVFPILPGSVNAVREFVLPLELSLLIENGDDSFAISGNHQ